jgi:acyl-CoA synthetase (AMP-forming)/AMP-acid ligase II
MLAGYGLTESIATVSCENLYDHEIGSVGKLMPHMQVKFGENDEILLKGPAITKGYYKKEAVTKASFTEDGWFRTGDAGYIKDGFLFLTERIKDLFKTSNGKYIAPQAIETKMVVDRYIDQISIIADERKFPFVLEIAGFTNHGELIGIEHIDGREGLVVHNRFVALVRTEGEGEKTTNLRQSSPTVPDTEGRNSFGFSDACNKVTVSELVANYATLIGQHIVIGRVCQPFGIDIDKPVAAAIIIHFDGIFRQFLRKLRLDACGNIKLCAPLCVVFDVKRDDHGCALRGY